MARKRPIWRAFARFTELIAPDGVLLMHTGLKMRPRVADGVRVYTYGGADGDFRASAINYSNGHITFDLVTPWSVIRHISLGVPVEVNIDNAVAACSAILLTGNLPRQCRLTTYVKTMGSFLGGKTPV